MIDVPPKYVNAPTSVVYDPDMPRALIVTYIRLRGLAWRNKDRFTPPMRIEKLLEITGLKRRAFYQHLSELRETGPLRWESPQPGHLVLYFDESDRSRGSPQELVHKNAQPLVVVNSSLNSDSENSEIQQHHGLDLEGGVGGEEIGAGICTALIKAGVVKERAPALASAYSAHYLMQKIDYYMWAINHGQAANVGWLIRAIEEDWPAPHRYASPEERCPLCDLPWTEDNPDCGAHRTWKYSDPYDPDEREAKIRKMCPWWVKAEAEREAG
jgi:hypothetical protein